MNRPGLSKRSPRFPGSAAALPAKPLRLLSSRPVASLITTATCAILALGLAGAPGPLRAETLTIEAEAYSGSSDVGGDPIHVTSCTGASGGLAVDGLDTAGEALAWQFELDREFSFIDSLRTAGDSGSVRVFAVGFTPEWIGDPLPVDTETTEGSGIG